MENRDQQSHTDSAGRGGHVVPLASIIDSVRHPWDATSILEWAITLWDSDPGLTVVVITEDGEASKLDNRLRVKLANIRRELGGDRIKRFGFTSTFIGWTLADGTQRQALCLSRKVNTRHTVLEAFDAVLGAKK